jgi:hypothetical protein
MSEKHEKYSLKQQNLLDLRRFCYIVPGAGIEPALRYQNRILNPARLPVPPPRQFLGVQIYIIFIQLSKYFKIK